MGFFEDHAGDATIKKWTLVEIDFPTPLYLTDLTDHDIEHDGHTWAASSLVPGSISNPPEGQNGSFQLTDDEDGTVFAALDATNGAENVVVRMWQAGFLAANKSAVPDAVVPVFNGRVDVASEGPDDVVSFSLMPSVLADVAMLPLRLFASLVRA